MFTQSNVSQATTSSDPSANRASRTDTVTVIMVEEEDMSTSSSCSSEGSEREMDVNDDMDLAQDDTDGADAETGEEINASVTVNMNSHHLLSHLRAIAQNREFQRVWVVAMNTFPFLVIILFKAVFNGFFSLFSLITAFLFFHISNTTFLSSLKERRSLHLLQSFASSIVFFNIQSFFYGLNVILAPMSFMSKVAKPATFFSTLHAVIIVDFAVKIITISLKAAIAAMPISLIGKRRQRRIFQWIEYTSQVYRYLLPIPQWIRYLGYTLFSAPLSHLGDNFFAALYLLYKALLIRVLGRRWLESTRRMVCLTAVGVKVPESCLEMGAHCTVCFMDFANPIKLPCDHVFCEECIATWLDKEYTCPLCRATVAEVAEEDNMWKSGETTYAPQLC